MNLFRFFLATVSFLFFVGFFGLLKLSVKERDSWINFYTNDKQTWWNLPIAIVNRGFITILTLKNP